MKKTIIFFFSALFISLTVFSQTTIKPGIGFNMTDFSTQNGEAKARFGYQFGGSIAVGKKIYFEPGVFYVGKSTEFSSSDTLMKDFDAKINGIRVPLAIGINLIGNEKTVISARVFGGASGFFITKVSDDMSKGDINKTSWGVFAGGGLDIWKFFVDLSYEWSLTDIQKDVSRIEIGKSRSFFTTVGLRINL